MTLLTIAPQGKKSGKEAWWRSPRLLRHGVMLFFFLFLLHVRR